MHALSGSSALSTIRIKGEVLQRPLMILIDSGSAHSFLDPRFAKEVKFEL